MPIPFRALSPLANVASVPRSIEFYRTLGFEVRGTFEPSDAEEASWASLESGDAVLMVAKADEPVVASQQAVLFYLYVDDVQAKHAELAAAGITVEPIVERFYNPRGEFRVVDPDGYVLMITHT